MEESTRRRQTRSKSPEEIFWERFSDRHSRKRLFHAQHCRWRSFKPKTLLVPFLRHLSGEPARVYSKTEDRAKLRSWIRSALRRFSCSGRVSCGIPQLHSSHRHRDHGPYRCLGHCHICRRTWDPVLFCLRSSKRTYPPCEPSVVKSSLKSPTRVALREKLKGPRWVRGIYFGSEPCGSFRLPQYPPTKLRQHTPGKTRY